MFYLIAEDNDLGFLFTVDNKKIVNVLLSKMFIMKL